METHTTHRKEMIILLLADMRNNRMIQGLKSVGLNTDNFYTKFTDLILEKMGFKDHTNEELCIWYEQTLRKVIDRDLYYYIFHERELAEHLYDLIALKKVKMQMHEPEPLRFVWGGLLKKWIIGKS